MARMGQSRFKDNLKRKAYHNMLLALLGVIVIVVIIILFGTKLLIGFSLFLGNFSHQEDNNPTQQSVSYIAPPQLDPAVDATNSATIALSGSALYGQTINLYRNNRRIDTIDVPEDKTFTFRNVTLQSGKNILKAKVITKDDKESDFSNEIIITYLNDPPTLSLTQPQEGQSFKKDDGSVTIEGQTDPSVRVTVNDFWAIVDASGNFSYSYNLHDGDNQLKIVAKDDAGNETTKEVTIKAE